MMVTLPGTRAASHVGLLSQTNWQLSLVGRLVLLNPSLHVNAPS